MALNTDLKMAIWTSGLTQFEVADRAGINESSLSLIINGRRPATDDQKRRIAKALRKPIDQLFPDTASTEASA